MSDDIVKFFLPDGTEVSNDPRWLAGNQARALEEALEATPNTGNAGIPDDEQAAQLGHVSTAGTLTHEQNVAGQVTGAVVQVGDAALAREAGYDATQPAIIPPAPDDSNEAVLAAREAAEKAAKEYADAVAAQAAEAAEGSDDAEEKPLTEMTGAELKAKAKELNLDISGLTKKAQLVELIENAQSEGDKE